MSKSQTLEMARLLRVAFTNAQCFGNPKYRHPDLDYVGWEEVQHLQMIGYQFVALELLKLGVKLPEQPEEPEEKPKSKDKDAPGQKTLF